MGRKKLEMETDYDWENIELIEMGEVVRPLSDRYALNSWSLKLSL